MAVHSKVKSLMFKRRFADSNGDNMYTALVETARHVEIPEMSETVDYQT